MHCLVAQVFQPAVSRVFNLRRVRASQTLRLFADAGSFERSADWKGRRYGRLENLRYAGEKATLMQPCVMQPWLI